MRGGMDLVIQSCSQALMGLQPLEGTGMGFLDTDRASAPQAMSSACSMTTQSRVLV